MQEDSGISANSISGSDKKRVPPSLPNWRVIDVHNGEEDAIISSPFCHPPIVAGNEPLAATATAAPWSKSGYQSALDFYERLQTCTDPYIAPMLKSALHDMEMAYRMYGPFCMVGSYNGGKDAVVIFHLMRAVHAHYCSEMQKEDDNFMIPRPRVIYFQHTDEFPEVLSLLDDTVERFDVDMLAFKEGVSFGEGLKYLVERNIAPGKDGLSFHDSSNTDRRLPPPHPLAFVLGTRKDDPNAGSQGVYAPSSHYMPPFLRVNPVLNWTYGHVWHFLRLFELPYCSLYDDGFTSLGTVKNTLPCPALRKNGEDEEYWPAYMLREWDMERAGRINKKKVEDTSAQKAASEAGDGKMEGDATMSQTSSTVSLPTDENESPELTKSISTVFSMDDVVTASNTRANVTASTQLLGLGQPTVGLIVIGDELLKGMTPDSNIIAAAKALRSNNISLSRVSIISDDGQDIVDEIRRFTNEVDVIITSGGVGPTHDDVTIKSIAEALGLDMEMHDEMAELLLEKMGSNDAGEKRQVGDDNSKEDRRKRLNRQMSEGQTKMAMLPESSVLQYLSDAKEEWPVLQCQNIFILPGVPTYFQKKINDLAAYLPTASSKLAQAATIGDEDIGLSVDISAQTEKQHPTRSPRSDTYRIVLSLEEESIVSALNATVAAHPHVSFGSYPIVDDPEYKTIITLEGRFYTGGYTKGSQRLLEQSVADTMESEVSSKDKKSLRSLFFSKEEMDRNVELALKDLKKRLPEEGILYIDSCDDLRTK